VDFVEIKPAQLPATNNDIEDELPFNDNQQQHLIKLQPLNNQ
jgi:hypothetical protein